VQWLLQSDAGVIERHVEAPVFVNGSIDKVFYVTLASHIRSNVLGFATLSFDGILYPLSQSFPAPAEAHLGAFGGELLCGCPSDS
jgi:hypothetical protein